MDVIIFFISSDNYIFYFERGDNDKFLLNIQNKGKLHHKMTWKNFLITFKILT